MYVTKTLNTCCKLKVQSVQLSQGVSLCRSGWHRRLLQWKSHSDSSLMDRFRVGKEHFFLLESLLNVAAKTMPHLLAFFFFLSSTGLCRCFIKGSWQSVICFCGAWRGQGELDCDGWCRNAFCYWSEMWTTSGLLGENPFLKHVGMACPDYCKCLPVCQRFYSEREHALIDLWVWVQRKKTIQN